MSREAFRKHVATEYAALPRPQGEPRRPHSDAFRDIGQGQNIPLPSEDVSGARLPDFKVASQIVPGQIVLPPLLVDGLLHRGSKLMLSGGSKSFKSWVLIDLALSVATGASWLGLSCKMGRTLYLNFELIDGFFEERVLSICRARNMSPPQGFLYWNLRGHCYDLAVLAKVIEARLAQFGPFDLVVVDPVYKALGDLDENKASDMTKLMNLIETMSMRTGASVAFGSHFSKGNQAAKEAKDRPSGSGVLIRDPDAIMTLTRHKEENCYVVNTELRYLPSHPEFVIRWNFPVMQADESLDPRQLYTPGATDDAPRQDASNSSFSENDILECLPFGGAQDTLWRKNVVDKFGRTGQAFYAAKASLMSKGLVAKQGQKYVRTQLRFEPVR